MLSPGMLGVMQTNEQYEKDWQELERFLTYEIFNSTGEQVPSETYRTVYQKMTEIKQRRNSGKPKKNYRVFGRSSAEGDDMMIYLQDDKSRTTQTFSLNELNQAWSKGALPTSVTFEELLSLSPFEWRTLMNKIELDFSIRPDGQGDLYGAITALVEE